MNTNELRNKFLQFFADSGHKIVPSSKVIPANDPTLMFTNAGMVQFKDVFTGVEKLSFARATSSQKCIRAGGKHNDLENVGFTARHHTFFEMLGNFSFGDYFKEQAIKFAWEFLTKNLAIPAEKLWVTVYKDDKETADIWLNTMKVSKERFSYCSEKDNFWAMGDTGPCGPCTEIFYDHGASILGGPPGSEDEDGDRYVEIWNLVFMQFDRSQDGKLTPLPKPSVDTGMGLERIAAVMQGVHSNYDIDLFQNLIKAAAKLANTKDYSANSLKVIADHIRSCAFMIADGVIPSNEGAGYVLRRIIRRALRHGDKLGIKDNFFHKLVQTLVDNMGEAYPELKTKQKQIEKILLQEEEQFSKTLSLGLKHLEQAIVDMNGNTIPGDTVFKLYDTYGFPKDLTQTIADEKNLKIDEDGFETLMLEQKERAKKSSEFKGEYLIKVAGKTEFIGYDALVSDSKVIAIIQDGKEVSSAVDGDNVALVLDKTPFYAESGGQVGDRGTIKFSTGVFKVTDTIKNGNLFLHIGEVVSGSINKNENVSAKVDEVLRASTVKNHSATHLLHAALRKVLGTHVEQKGSYVGPDKLRFDFSHFSAISKKEIAKIEDLVNEEILKNQGTDINITSKEKAIEQGAIAFFGEKYGETVRVLNIGKGFSVELCGGTHVHSTGDIGCFKILSEASVASGVRRIEAVTALGVIELIREYEGKLFKLGNLFKSNFDNLLSKAEQAINKNRTLEKENETLRQKLESKSGDDLLNQAIEIKNVKVLVKKLDAFEPKNLRTLLDQLKNKLKTAVVVLAVVNNNKINLIAGVTKDNTDKINAKDLVNVVAQQVGGKGGGRPDMAQAGGQDVAKLDTALESVIPWLEVKL